MAASPNSETVHYLTYVKRKIVARGTNQDQKRDVSIALWVPKAHVCGQKWLYDRYQTGEKLVLWQISFLRGRGIPMLPSIDARIQVTKAFDRKSDLPDLYTKQLWDQHCRGSYKGDTVNKANISARGRKPAKKNGTYVFVADENASYYLPWINAQSLFQGPEFAKYFASLKNDFTRDEDSFSRLPQHLQTPMCLTKELAETLEAFALRIKRYPRAFISYRWKNATACVAKLAIRLAEFKIASWWDRWSMPRSIGELKNPIDNEKLFAILLRAAENSAVAFTIQTEGYSYSPATAYELGVLAALESQGKISVFRIPADGKALDRDAPLDSVLDKVLSNPKLLERALTIFEKLFGPEHPEVARSLDRLGELYLHRRRYAGAQSVLKRAAAIWRKVAGPEEYRSDLSHNKYLSAKASRKLKPNGGK